MFLPISRSYNKEIGCEKEEACRALRYIADFKESSFFKRLENRLAIEMTFTKSLNVLFLT